MTKIEIAYSISWQSTYSTVNMVHPLGSIILVANIMTINPVYFEIYNNLQSDHDYNHNVHTNLL